MVFNEFVRPWTAGGGLRVDRPVYVCAVWCRKSHTDQPVLVWVQHPALLPRGVGLGGDGGEESVHLYPAVEAGPLHWLCLSLVWSRNQGIKVFFSLSTWSHFASSLFIQVHTPLRAPVLVIPVIGYTDIDR